MTDLFYDYYQQEILPSLQGYEEFRLKKLQKQQSKKAILIVSSVVFVAIALLYLPSLAKEAYLSFIHPNAIIKADLFLSKVFLGLSIFSMIGIIYGFYYLKKASNEFIFKIKTELYHKILGFYPKLKYFPYKTIDNNLVRILFENFSQINSQDHIQGEYKSVNFRVTDIELERVIQSHRIVDNQNIIENKVIQIFKGLFIAADLYKKFSSITYVIPNNINNKLEFIASALKKIKLEDPQFSRVFSVYSDNQIESRYLLTPSLMERLLVLNKGAIGEGIRCCFVNNQLILAFPRSEDLFPHLSLNQSLLQYEQIKQVIEQLDIIFAIIDDLRLDLNIGL